MKTAPTDEVKYLGVTPIRKTNVENTYREPVQERDEDLEV